MTHFLITGASSGIGAALAVELGRRGYSVGLVARRAELLEEVADRVREAGGTAEWAAADVVDREALTAAIRSLEERLGEVDCAVASAGGGAPTPAREVDPERIAKLMRLNFDGAVHTFAAVLPDMVARRSGHIAVVSSMAAYRGLPPSGGYSAAKSAISVLMEAWSIELRPLGVAVTTINPWFVRTPLTEQNRFPMPFMVEVDRAARIIATGLLRRRRNITFPWALGLFIAALRALPGLVFEWVFARFSPTAPS
jgi:short-subunit dehydrogenase